MYVASLFNAGSPAPQEVYRADRVYAGQHYRPFMVACGRKEWRTRSVMVAPGTQSGISVPGCGVISSRLRNMPDSCFLRLARS